MIAKHNREIRELRAELRRLQPVRTPGVLTSKTTRGVSRTPTAKTTQPTTNQTSIPRWG